MQICFFKAAQAVKGKVLIEELFSVYSEAECVLG